MQYKINKLDGLKRKLDIQVSVEQVQELLNDNYRKKQRKADLPGFRKGKVPLNHVRPLYQEEVKRDTVMDIVNKFYSRVLDQENLKPSSDPRVEVKSPITENKAFQFSAILEIQPEINVDKDFKVKIPQYSLKVEEKEISEVLDQLRKVYAKYEEITADRGAHWGDIIDLEVNDLSGFTGIKKNTLLEMKKEHTLEIEGLSEGLVGMKKGDKKTISVHLSENYPIKEHAGKVADLEVTLLAIKQRILPTLEEDLKRYKCKDEQEIRQMIRQNLEQEDKDKAYRAMRKKALEYLVEKNPIDLLPEEIVESQKQNIISSVVDQLKQSGMTEENIEEYKKNHQKEFQKQARFNVHLAYLIYDLADKWNISVNAKEIEELHNGKQKPSKDEYDRLADMIVREKTIGRLIDTADKTEVKEKI